MRVKKISHVAIAVPDETAPRKLYEDLLGLHFAGSETVESEGVSTHFFSIGESNLEMLEPLHEDTPVGKFMAKQGPGMHHIALEVDDIQDALKAMVEKGVALIDQTARKGVENTDIAFLHPKATKILMEFVKPGE